MKRFTHPFRSYTLIQTKDGRVYGKYWIYYRAALRLESGRKNWDSVSRVHALAKKVAPVSTSETKMQRRFLFRNNILLKLFLLQN